MHNTFRQSIYSRPAVWRVVLIVVAIVVLWLGVSWKKGWFPFRGALSPQELEEEMINAGTAVGNGDQVSPDVLKAASPKVQTKASVTAGALEAGTGH